MNKQITYNLTGFVDEPQKIKFYQKCLQNCGGKFIQKLAESTHVLVVNATHTQKFKIAQMTHNPIICVTEKWIEDSHAMKSIQPFDKYKITQNLMFLGTTVAVCGFSIQKTQKIRSIICQRKGQVITKYKATQIYHKLSLLQQQPDIVLASSDQIQRSKHSKLPSATEYQPPLVSIQWLQDSLNSHRCKYPIDYALNIVSTKPILSYKKKLISKLNTFMDIDLMDRKGDFLGNTVVHVDKELNVDLLRLFKNLIAACGGFYVEKFTALVTHVLIVDVDQKKYQSFKKYGNKVHILRPEWLVDSILFYNHLDQQDYVIRSFRINDQTIRNMLIQQANRNNQNSISFNSLPLVTSRINSNSHTLPLEQNMHSSTLSSSRPTRRIIRSQTFKNKSFYFPNQLTKDPFYSDLIKTIQNANGHVYNKINKKSLYYVPLKDSSDNLQIVKELVRNKFIVKVVSNRWVNICLKKNSFIQPDLDQYLHFRAFDFYVPLPDFHKYIFDVIGYDPIPTLRIRDLLPVLGSTKTNPNKSQITHILCGPSYEESEFQTKINKILNENKKVQLISGDWILECLSSKKLIDTDPFVINLNNYQSLNTPYKRIDNVDSSQSDQRIKDMSKTSIKQTP